MSFLSVLENIIATLENDPDLQVFASTNWGKNITVKKGFQRRTEIGCEQLPLIRVTRPEVDPDIKSGSRIVMHTVRIYAGFYQANGELATDQVIVFEEKIREALIKDRRRGQTAQTTIPGEAANDEGYLHPSYFLVMDVQIQTND